MQRKRRGEPGVSIPKAPGQGAELIQMSGFPFPGAAPPRNRLVGFGLILVVLGWLALVADFALADAQLQPGNLVATLSVKGDIATLAEMLVLTGLGLSILGGLREGFGALNRFFDAVLQRSSSPRPSPMPEPPLDDLDDEIAPPRSAAERVAPANVMPPAPAVGRNYQILPDGSVEVETLLGTRVFASMDEARDFIR